jgi:hypothetical protein
MTRPNRPASIEALTPANYNPRTITPAADAGLAESMKRFGDLSGLTINRRADGSHVIVAGHQRRRKHLEAHGDLPIDWLDGERGFYTTPDGQRWPVRIVELSPADERAANLIANSPHVAGEFDDAKAEAMLAELRDTIGDAFEALRFDALMAEVMQHAQDQAPPKESYTKKIVAPIYEPKGDCPPSRDLYDETTTAKLLSDIEAADVPDDVRLFLRSAATRHTRFNFARIAEFYAHASPAVQSLMEDSALVIIDFNKAIELGFVNLTGKLAQIADVEGWNNDES